jgi:hypothetical protein
MAALVVVSQVEIPALAGAVAVVPVLLCWAQN